MSDWPDCPEPGCRLKVCLALNSDRCFQHTPGNQHVKRWMIEARTGVPPMAHRGPRGVEEPRRKGPLLQALQL